MPRKKRSTPDPVATDAIFRLQHVLCLKQKEMAQLLGITPQSLNRVAQGAPLSRKLAFRLAELAREKGHNDLYTVFAKRIGVTLGAAPPPSTPVSEQIYAMRRNVRVINSAWSALLNYVKPLDNPPRDPEEKNLRAGLFKKIVEQMDFALSNLGDLVDGFSTYVGQERFLALAKGELNQDGKT